MVVSVSLVSVSFGRVGVRLKDYVMGSRSEMDGDRVVRIRSSQLICFDHRVIQIHEWIRHCSLSLSVLKTVADMMIQIGDVDVSSLPISRGRLWLTSASELVLRNPSQVVARGASETA